MMMRRDALRLGLACLAGRLVMPRAAAAQSKYPERPIKLVIPFTPGGLTDAVSRLWADKMKALLGLVFIENQGGAGGLVGGAAVARAQPDGYTLLLGSTASQVVSPIAANPAPYDAVKDFAPISILVIAAIGVLIHPSVPVRNLKELIGYAKANPGKLSYGSGGVGATTHLTGELFKSLTGTADIVHVPYKGGSQMFSDLISGHIPMIMANVTGQALELHRAGRVRILAVTTTTRVIAAPDIPTAVEAGLPGMIAHNFIGLFAPAGTPSVGVTFQQVQKYERGANRVGASRLMQICAVLEVTPAWLFEGAPGPQPQSSAAARKIDGAITAFHADELAPQLILTFPRLPARIKRSMVALMTAVAGGTSGPD
jgi:tripartite-type tricarboxylate transporter receptor subunit TctC